MSTDELIKSSTFSWKNELFGQELNSYEKDADMILKIIFHLFFGANLLMAQGL